jgi:hypothetical protein
MKTRVVSYGFAFGLLLSLNTSIHAQDGTIVTNLADLAYGAFSGEHSIYLPFEPWHWQGYSIDGGQPWWVDFSLFPCLGPLQTCTNVSTDTEFHGVPVVSAQLTKNVLTGEVLFHANNNAAWQTTHGPATEQMQIYPHLLDGVQYLTGLHPDGGTNWSGFQKQYASSPNDGTFTHTDEPGIADLKLLYDRGGGNPQRWIAVSVERNGRVG